MLATVLSACAQTGDGGAAAAPRTLEDEGRSIAVRECSSCHAISQAGRSPNGNAPPLRTVLRRYNPRSLEADFADGMRVGHFEMPRLHLDDYSATALVAYLQAIQD